MVGAPAQTEAVIVNYVARYATRSDVFDPPGTEESRERGVSPAPSYSELRSPTGQGRVDKYRFEVQPGYVRTARNMRTFGPPLRFAVECMADHARKGMRRRWDGRDISTGNWQDAVPVGAWRSVEYMIAPSPEENAARAGGRCTSYGRRHRALPGQGPTAGSF